MSYLEIAVVVIFFLTLWNSWTLLALEKRLFRLHEGAGEDFAKIHRSLERIE